ncbi:LysR substrate-binding domain-containing protein [Anaeromyxobacter oryzae]|uniref:LysR family transcriptional regulator n=1 Tax=Anaeromyxobacter oryzae TaxID=2918170 RepID=A0ABN6MLT3_9BACT|nr:LysR substrate-binding domain-containing protein [Anaeromyxobacter oryzae]BDG01886.1 LysR family transcriptional regulator [Anaeromyxobacter oryzae]
MELRHLRYFVAVAEELHFGRAAARLGIAQPPLSQQIRQLEDELGAELLVRARRRVALTEAGRVFLAEARGILQRAAAAVTAARRAARGETGSLAVGVVASATYGLVPRVFRTFRARHPDVAVSLAVMSTGAQVAALRAGQIQLGLARPPFGDETLVADALVEEPVVAALAADHALAARRALRLRALAAEPFVLFPRDRRPGWYDFVLGVCRGAGFQPVVGQEAPDLATAMALVAAGLGVTLVPASVRDLRREGVAYRPLGPPAPRTTLLALRRPGDALPVVDRFLAVAREVLRGAGARRRATAASPHARSRSRP